MLRSTAPDGHVPIQSEPWDGTFSGDTQPPLLALATAYVRKAGGVNDSKLAWALPKLCSYIEWDIANRDNAKNGLFEWHQGTESGLDNAPMFDTANPQVGRTQDLASTEFSVYVALEMDLISKMHAELGNATGAAHWAALSNRTAAMVHSQLWDERDGFYYYRQDRGGARGAFVRIKTVSGFAPLLLDGVPDERVVALLGHLNNASEFDTVDPIATVAACEPTYSTNMWRGPVWTNTNWFTVLGLRKYGHVPGALAAADRIQAATVRLVAENYERYGTSFEFYDSAGKLPPTELERKSHPHSGGVRDYHWTAANTFWMLHNKEGTLP
jgi:glycogen debranching enzyme